MRLYKFLLVILFSIAPLISLQAGERLDKADTAVANVLFEYEEPGYEFASWRVNERGEVNILFARNMPEELYGEILTRLQKHPDIPSVLSSKGGPACGLW